MTLLGITLAVLAVISVGIIADRSQRDPKVMGRVLTVWAIGVALTLAYTIATGQFLRYAPGSDSSLDSDP